jgi:hypothetical protein
MKHGLQDYTPSRLFIYWCERSREGTTSYDSGAQLRDGVWAMANRGAPPEALCPFEPSLLLVEPNGSATAAAKSDLAILYAAIPQTLPHMKAAVAQGYPWMCGFTVYESFEGKAVAVTGIVPKPVRGDRVVGGHAVCVVGYNDRREQFLVRNSWAQAGGSVATAGCHTNISR